MESALPGFDLDVERLQTPDKLGREEVQVWREVALSDLHFFAVYVCGYSWFSGRDAVHGQMARQMAEPTRPQMHLKYRGMGKTMCSIARTLWRACQNPSTYSHVTVVADASLGKNVLGLVGSHVEHNKIVHALFPEIRKNPKNWSVRDGFRLSSRASNLIGPTWEVRTAGQPFSGRHVDEVTWEDLVNDENWKSRDAQEDLKQKWQMVQPTVESDCQFINATRYADYDLWGYVIETMYPDNLDLYCVPVRGMVQIDQNGALRWSDTGIYADPDNWDDLRFNMKRKSMNSLHLFSCQYLLDTTQKGAEAFDREWLKWEIPAKLPPMTVYIAGDGASGQGTSKAALVVAGIDEDGIVYVLEAKSDYQTEQAFIDGLFELAELYEPYVVGVERYAHGGWTLFQAIQQRMQETRKYFTLEPLTGKQKDRRIRETLWAPYQQGAIVHSTTIRRGELEQELETFPDGKSKDEIDAESYVVGLALKHGYFADAANEGAHDAVAMPRRSGDKIGYTLEELVGWNLEEKDEAPVHF